MEFTNLRLKEVQCVVKFSPTEKFWTTSNRTNHIIGIQFKGKVLHDFGYKKFTIGENYIYFLNQKDKFSAKVIEQSSAFSVHFSTYEEIETDSFCIKINDNSEISSLLGKMDNLKTLYPTGNNLSASVFYTLCSVFDRIRLREYAKTDERMIKAKEYVDLNFKDKLCIINASKICGLSRRRFNDLFCLHFGTTPNRYVIIKKIELSKQLLSIGSLSVTEVSNLCGFSDIYYFSKVFKKETGISPNKFKNN